MRAVAIPAFGDADVLTRMDLPVPAPEPGAVAILSPDKIGAATAFGYDAVVVCDEAPSRAVELTDGAGFDVVVDTSPPCGLGRRGDIRVAVSDHLPLEEAAQAHRRLESGATTGKLIRDVRR